MASNPDQTGDEATVKASEPIPNAAPKPDAANLGGGEEPEEADTDYGSGRPLRPEAASERANAIDENTAGDGVAFFEGGDGSESAHGDIERGG